MSIYQVAAIFLAISLAVYWFFDNYDVSIEKEE